MTNEPTLEKSYNGKAIVGGRCVAGLGGRSRGSGYWATLERMRRLQGYVLPTSDACVSFYSVAVCTDMLKCKLATRHGMVVGCIDQAHLSLHGKEYVRSGHATVAQGPRQLPSTSAARSLAVVLYRRSCPLSSPADDLGRNPVVYLLREGLSSHYDVIA